MPTLDADTRAWIRNPSDEKAAANGCTLDVLTGAWVVWWIEHNCRLYEGEQAGEPLVLHGCHECGTLPSAEDTWNENRHAHAEAIERAARFNECVRKGHAVDWQYECTMRMFGWQKFSPRWQRLIRRFRQASIWIGKKNKKSPTLASWGWYLLVGDSEPGQKVFFFAKNGEQARKIAGEHAVAMYHQLPEELHDDCKLNQTTYRITHLPSLSWMEPNSSGHSQHKEAKEGLNGSLLIDETHVVDRDLLKIISRAGISRSEPLHIEVSTAGNDPESYGKERFDYALQVLNGEREDEKLFAAVYAAPQNLTDEELATDPMKYARMANPALGHTVDADELLDDYRTSQGKGVSEFADCKMYRFNLWQQTSNPWIDSLRWDKCRREFTEKDLIGRRCVAGLDLSRTRDTTALVLAFEGDDGGHYLWPYFWLPEDRAREIDHKTPVLTWARSGHLELTPGGVVDYGFIVTRFIELHTIFGISELVYDPRFAEEPTQWMSDGLTDPSGKVIFKGTGVPRHPFDQSDNNFAVPTDDFEKLVIAGKLWHNGHPVLAAQVGRATATVRPFTKVKRVKKPNDPVKSVDGVIAAIMALGRLMQAPQPQYNPSWLYD